MIAWLLAGLALPIAAAWLLLGAMAAPAETVDGERGDGASRCGEAALRAGLAIGLGLGVAACLATLVVLAGGGRAAVIAADLAVGLAAGLA
ncbi:MAG: hypothetical protein ACRERC_11655, partial [Candidatus Binatia bacterium]